ncbi:MAG: hypothetical protein Q9227_005403 [Pyrenula ochraceoflavens]
MLGLTSILLFATAISAVPTRISRRDTAETLANLQDIDDATNSLTSTVNNWDGSLLGALGINGAAQDLGNQINSANTDAQDEPVASSADSQEIIGFISGTLEPDIAASLDALVAREADFEADGLSSLVLNTLNTLKTDTDNYSTTLEGIASSDQTANAEAAAASIDDDFNAAIAAFS